MGNNNKAAVAAEKNDVAVFIAIISSLKFKKNKISDTHISH
jgi:hypothetical protein